MERAHPTTSVPVEKLLPRRTGGLEDDGFSRPLESTAVKPALRSSGSKTRTKNETVRPPTRWLGAVFAFISGAYPLAPSA